MNAGEIVGRLEKLRGLEPTTVQGALSILIGDVTRSAELERYRSRVHNDRTITIGNAVLSICDFRACVVVQAPHRAFPECAGPLTYVWLREVRDAFVIPGDHTEKLQTAVEGQP